MVMNMTTATQLIKIVACITCITVFILLCGDDICLNYIIEELYIHVYHAVN